MGWKGTRGTSTGTVITSPKKAARLAKKKRAEEAAWKARNGPVTSRQLTAEELAELAPRTPPATP